MSNWLGAQYEFCSTHFIRMKSTHPCLCSQ